LLTGVFIEYKDRNEYEITVNTGFYHSQKKNFEDKYDVLIQLKTGAAFGLLLSAINRVEMRTYITNDMLKGDQVALSKALNEKFHFGVLRKKEGGEEIILKRHYRYRLVD
jgi:hypothetical protein